MLSYIRSPPPHSLHLRRHFLCKCSVVTSTTPDLDRYHEVFARRMAMAGVKPRHRIALGVSGGADSMALCVLTKHWKSKNESLSKEEKKCGFVEGLLGVVVDHKLRPESTEEANLVSGRLSKMGIRCEIVSCVWSDGKPKMGHLEESARDMRYNIFQDVCSRHQISVLLVGHHADDQAELFILRLSRNSGVFGLAGMAFSSQIFPENLESLAKKSRNLGILLIRPMLEFYKHDMYRICQAGHQEWVEDPSNQSSEFTRNRIRFSLINLSCLFKSELHMLISACRLTRSFAEHACNRLMEQSVEVVDKYGYAIIDLKQLNPSLVSDLCLSKFLASVLQFISQRHRPIRGGVLQLLLDYIRNTPCKTALTAAGCYLCPGPRSKGMKVLVSSSPNSPEALNSKMPLICSMNGRHPSSESVVYEIIMNAKSYEDNSLSLSDAPLLHVKSSNNVLEEVRKLHIISESTFRNIMSLQVEENKRFNTQAETKSDGHLQQKTSPSFVSGVQLGSHQACHFMHRFLVSWKFVQVISAGGNFSDSDGTRCDSKAGDQPSLCESCAAARATIASVRVMVDADWLYLSNLGKRKIEITGEKPVSFSGRRCIDNKGLECQKFTYLSAQNALTLLKPIPLSARRALPVLVDSRGLLLSIPSVGFQACPFLSAEALFLPRVPLGGGFGSYS